MKAAGSLREQIELLERRGDLVRIETEVDPRFEIAALSKKLEQGPALFFERIRGYSGCSLVLNTDNLRERIAAALGTDNLGLIPRYLEAIKNPIGVRVVPDGPVKEVKTLDNIDLLKVLPVLTHHEQDGGPYITSAVIIAEDPARGIRNCSYTRLQAVGGDELRTLIQPRHLFQLVDPAERENKAFPVAIVIGLPISIRLAAATWGAHMPFGFDELTLAGGLQQYPVDVVRCETSEIHVPAMAEYVLEGEVLPGVRRQEGPYAEFTGNYASVGDRHVIKVRAITHRRKPIYQGLLSFTPEHHSIGGTPKEPVVYLGVKTCVPGTQAVHLTPSSCGCFHAVIQIKKRHPGDGKNAIIAGLYSIPDIKLVTVVDDDVDPFNPREVEWAIATRFQADRDLIVISGAKGNELDHSCAEEALTAKMGIDATKPVGADQRFEKVRVPGVTEIKLENYME
ncbi:MAG: UbiD family decarboxylase [Firmicutes bacterium]|nr:UbiD family decarboxylase [Bacillota bacterium]